VQTILIKKSPILQVAARSLITEDGPGLPDAVLDSSIEMLLQVAHTEM
jgi:hypothetical protein